MATYVLVHGGAHRGWCYGPVARVLRASGHDVHTPTMTGMGEQSHLRFPGSGPIANCGVTNPDDIAWMAERVNRNRPRPDDLRAAPPVAE